MAAGTWSEGWSESAPGRAEGAADWETTEVVPQEAASNAVRPRADGTIRSRNCTIESLRSVHWQNAEIGKRQVHHGRAPTPGTGGAYHRNAAGKGVFGFNLGSYREGQAR